MYDSMPADWLCCAYLRKSREDEEREKQGKYKTLERHKAILESLSSDNGHKIAQWYPEIVSGETIEGRPEVKKLLADLASGKWDAVYVVEASRLGRGGGSDQEKIVNAFRYTNTWLVTEEKVYDPSSKADMRQLKNDLRSSEDELDSITTRLTRGKYRSAQEGRWQATGRTPYGWRAVRIAGLWQLRPDENHCHMLRIYDLLESGLTPWDVANIYNAEGIPTPRGGDHWTAAIVRAIALNPANCGYVVFGKHKTMRVFDPETFETKKVRVQNDKPVMVKGLHYGTGGISEERFERITGRLVESAHLRKGLELKNPLARLLKCGKCGYAMNHHRMSSGKSYGYFYQHPAKRNMTRECDGCRGARDDLVMDTLVASLRSLCTDIELRIKADNRASEHEAHIEAMRKELEKVRAARSRAMEAYEAGAYTIAELKARKDEAEKRMESIERAIKDAKPPKYTPELVVSINKCIDMLLDDTVSVQVKNDFLKSVIGRIDYYNDTPPFVHDNKVHLEIFLRQ